MSDFSFGAPKVTVRAASAKAVEATIRWEAEDGSDAAAIDELIAADSAQFLAPAPKDAQALVRRIRQSPVYQRMVTHVAELDGKLVGFAMFAQVRVGVRTHLLCVGSSVAPDAPANTRTKLLDAMVKSARAGFYSAVFATTAQDALPGLALKPAQDFDVSAPPAIPAATLVAGELVPYGLSALGGQMVLDEAFGPLA